MYGYGGVELMLTFVGRYIWFGMAIVEDCYWLETTFFTPTRYGEDVMVQAALKAWSTFTFEGRQFDTSTKANQYSLGP